MTHERANSNSSNQCLSKNLNPSPTGLTLSHTPLPTQALGLRGKTGEGLFNMSKRFTETDKWKDSWFLDLSLESKVFFQYLCDNCDMAGFYQRHDRTISALTGIPTESIPKAIKDLEKSVILKDGVFWVVNFLHHQKHTPLNPNNNAHLSVIRSLINNSGVFGDLYSNLVGFSLEELRGLLGANDQVPSPIGKGKGNNIIEVVKKNEDSFNEFWLKYPYKANKPSALRAWNKINPDDSLKAQMFEAIEKATKSENWLKEDGKYIPLPASWLNGHRWEDQIVVKKKDRSFNPPLQGFPSA